MKYIKGGTRQPANNYFDLKLNIGTFMALLWCSLETGATITRAFEKFTQF